jgi:hypothetical protein
MVCVMVVGEMGPELAVGEMGPELVVEMGPELA